jgi:hypothetical protein
VRLILFDGTTEEFSAIAPHLGVTPSQQQDSRPVGAAVFRAERAQSDADEERFVTFEEAIGILGRRALSDDVLAMIERLYRSGNSEVTSEDLRAVNDLSSSEFRGMLGAFGRRVRHTVSANVRFFDQIWKPDLGQYVWKLPESVRRAIEHLKLVK